MDLFSLSLLDRGGPMMWPLLVLGVVGFWCFAERALFFHRLQMDVGTFLDGIQNLLRRGRRHEALALCEERDGPVPRVIRAMLLTQGGEEKYRCAAREAALLEIPLLERRLRLIAAIAKAAPLLGLLGTVLAILKAFSLMEGEGPYADAAQFFTAISEGLLSTATGLAIAVIAHFAHHFLSSRLRSIVFDMEWAATRLMHFFEQIPETIAKPHVVENSEEVLS